jgi:hypothetical protein
VKSRDLLLLALLLIFGMFVVDRAIYTAHEQAKAQRIDRVLSLVERLTK